MNPIFHLTTALGPGALAFAALSGREEVSRLFAFTLNLTGSGPEFDPDTLLGTPMTLAIDLPDGSRRHLGGECVQVACLGIREGRLHYQATLRPWLWYASRDERCRLFERRSVPEMVRQVLASYPFRTRFLLSRPYAPRLYCAQYRESDADFVMRLLESEGLWFWFEHLPGRHELVIADDLAFSQAQAPRRRIRYCGPGRGAGHPEYLDSWSSACGLGEPAPRSQASGCTASLAPGQSFQLEGHPGQATPPPQWVAAADYRFSVARCRSACLSTRIETHPGDRPFRPARQAPRPQVLGRQVAVVEQDAVVFDDGHSRLRVRFAWPDGPASGWVRSALPAGSGSRLIGQQVLVDHLDGDPDQPLVIALVNASLGARIPAPVQAPSPETASLIHRCAAGGDGVRFVGEREVIVRCNGHRIRITPDGIEVRPAPLERVRAVATDRTTHVPPAGLGERG